MQPQFAAELYLFREKIQIDRSAYKLLLASWCAEKAPAWYWLRSAESKEIVKLAVEICEHPDKDVRGCAYSLLIDLLDKPTACGLLKHRSALVREAALKALAKIGGREELPLIKEMLKDEDWRVRGAAVEAFMKFAKDIDAINEFAKVIVEINAEEVMEALIGLDKKLYFPY